MNVMDLSATAVVIKKSHPRNPSFSNNDVQKMKTCATNPLKRFKF